MATYSRVKFGSSTDGQGIKVVATGTVGTALHVSHATAQDEVWMWAWNSRTSSQLLTIEIDGTTDPDNIFEVTLDATTEGIQPVILGTMTLTGSSTLKAFAANANEVIIFGYVNRIT